MTTNRIWVLVETQESKITPTSFELVTAARNLGESVDVFVSGQLPAEGVGELSQYNVENIYCVSDLAGSMVGPKLAAAMVKIGEEQGLPRAILFGQTYSGRDVLARLSVKLDTPVLTNVVNLYVSDGNILSEHAIFGGEEIVTASFTHSNTQLFAVRAKSFVAAELAGPPATVTTVQVDNLGATDAAKILSSHVEARSGPKLDEASVVVSGGRGLGQSENYAMIEELAKLLHGAPGASRAIVDAGWVPYSYQVGQTGKTVKPSLYVAVGISGATQHMVGMKGAKNIIAINKDKEAPIFQIADLGVVGDAHKIIPKLIEALRSRG